MSSLLSDLGTEEDLVVRVCLNGCTGDILLILSQSSRERRQCVSSSQNLSTDKSLFIIWNGLTFNQKLPLILKSENIYLIYYNLYIV